MCKDPGTGKSGGVKDTGQRPTWFGMLSVGKGSKLKSEGWVGTTFHKTLRFLFTCPHQIIFFSHSIKDD